MQAGPPTYSLFHTYTVYSTRNLIKSFQLSGGTEMLLPRPLHDNDHFICSCNCILCCRKTAWKIEVLLLYWIMQEQALRRVYSKLLVGHRCPWQLPGRSVSGPGLLRNEYYSIVMNVIYWSGGESSVWNSHFVKLSGCDEILQSDWSWWNSTAEQNSG